MAIVTYNDAERDYSADYTSYNGAGEDVDITLRHRNGLWTVVSGDTPCSSLMVNNMITIDIDDEDYTFNPLSRVPNGSGYLYHKAGDLYYIKINTTQM